MYVSDIGMLWRLQEEEQRANFIIEKNISTLTYSIYVSHVGKHYHNITQEYDFLQLYAISFIPVIGSWDT